MSVTVSAVITVDYFEYLAKFMGQGTFVPGTPTDTAASPKVWDPRIKFFRIGEGGWYLNGGVKTRRTPDPALRNPDTGLQDIDAVCDIGRAAVAQPTRYGATERYYFDKALSSSDFAFVSPATQQVTCLLDVGEFNTEADATAPAGCGVSSPALWEIGLFCDHPTVNGEYLMVAYGTFATEQVKIVGRQLENVVSLVGTSS